MTDRFRAALPRPSTASSAPDSVASIRRKEISPSAGSELAEYCAHEAGLDTFPNDLTRMLYLASLRDCNSGRYLHPQLSPAVGADAIDNALRACHEQVFRRLLVTPTPGYVVQLKEYVRYANAETRTILVTWESLQAYRATVPVLALPMHSELFCLNVDLALTILQSP
jgi:hypothetical protein